MVLAASLFAVSAVASPMQIDPPPPLPGYRLVWRDEFDGKALDPRKWEPWHLGKRRDAVNVADAAQLDGGRLLISTRRTPLADGATQVTTGGVWSHGLFMPLYGYIEARIKFQSEVGHWGAFWLNSNTMGQRVGDPSCGVEMDVVEFHQKLAGGTEVVQTLHWDGYGKDHKSKGVSTKTAEPSRRFHDYAILWEPSGYVFYVDGKETWRTKPEDKIPVSTCPEHMILSLEVGPWAGKIEEARLPDAMAVDWVCVWQRAP